MSLDLETKNKILNYPALVIGYLKKLPFTVKATFILLLICITIPVILKTYLFFNTKTCDLVITKNSFGKCFISISNDLIFKSDKDLKISKGDTLTLFTVMDTTVFGSFVPMNAVVTRTISADFSTYKYYFQSYEIFISQKLSMNKDFWGKNYSPYIFKSNYRITHIFSRTRTVFSKGDIIQDSKNSLGLTSIKVQNNDTTRLK